MFEEAAIDLRLFEAPPPTTLLTPPPIPDKPVRRTPPPSNEVLEEAPSEADDLFFALFFHSARRALLSLVGPPVEEEVEPKLVLSDKAALRVEPSILNRYFNSDNTLPLRRACLIQRNEQKAIGRARKRESKGCENVVALAIEKAHKQFIKQAQNRALGKISESPERKASSFESKKIKRRRSAASRNRKITLLLFKALLTVQISFKT